MAKDNEWNELVKVKKKRREILLNAIEAQWATYPPRQEVAILYRSSICSPAMCGDSGIRRIRELRIAGDIRYTARPLEERPGDVIYSATPGFRHRLGPYGGQDFQPEVISIRDQFGYCSVCRLITWKHDKVHKDCPGEHPEPQREEQGGKGWYFTSLSRTYEFFPGRRQDYLLAIILHRVYTRREMFQRLNRMFPGDEAKNKQGVVVTLQKLVSSGFCKDFGGLISAR